MNWPNCSPISGGSSYLPPPMRMYSGEYTSSVVSGTDFTDCVFDFRQYTFYYKRVLGLFMVLLLQLNFFIFLQYFFFKKKGAVDASRFKNSTFRHGMPLKCAINVQVKNNNFCRNHFYNFVWLWLIWLISYRADSFYWLCDSFLTL